MPVQTVRADIIDIGSDVPGPSDEFVVDTNSWKEFTYSRVRQPKPGYPVYIKKALSEGSKLYACGITLMELASAIERDEWEIYRQTVVAIEKKDFRHDDAKARAAVVAEVSSSWSQVMDVSQLIDLHLDAAAIARALRTFQTCPVDGYDTLLIEAMTRRGVFNLITDDGDFATVPDVRVYTANAHIISVARRQGRLLRRD
jgi:predicted nucleic acid-binding protein